MSPRPAWGFESSSSRVDLRCSRGAATTRITSSNLAGWWTGGWWLFGGYEVNECGVGSRKRACCTKQQPALPPCSLSHLCSAIRLLMVSSMSAVPSSVGRGGGLEAGVWEVWDRLASDKFLSSCFLRGLQPSHANQCRQNTAAAYSGPESPNAPPPAHSLGGRLKVHVHLEGAVDRAPPSVDLPRQDPRLVAHRLFLQVADALLRGRGGGGVEGVEGRDLV